LKNLALTADGKYLIQINSNGDLYFHNVSTGAVPLTGKLIDDELVLYDSSLRYEATPEGAAYIYVQMPGEPGVFSLDQFASRLRTPGVGEQRLRGTAVSTPAAAGLIPPRLSVQEAAQTYKATALAPAGIMRLRVQVDGVVVKEQAFNGSQSEVTATFSEADFTPAHWISFVAQDRNGILSITRAFQVPPRPYKGQLRTIAIGVNIYAAGDAPDLTYAVGDAERFEGAVRQSIAPAYTGYSGEKLTQAVDADSVQSRIALAARATERNDTLILFVASHGLDGPEGFSLALPAITPHGPASVLPFRKIAEDLKGAQGRIFVFLDACHAGTATNDKAIDELVASNANIVIIAASKGRQYSLEGAQWGGGAFTRAALEQTPWLRRVFWAGPQSVN
jgi:hypothetical protein